MQTCCVRRTTRTFTLRRREPRETSAFTLALDYQSFKTSWQARTPRGNRFVRNTPDRWTQPRCCIFQECAEMNGPAGFHPQCDMNKAKPETYLFVYCYLFVFILVWYFSCLYEIMIRHHLKMIDLSACKSTFTRSNLKQWFSVCTQSFASLWRNFGPFFLTTVLQFIRIHWPSFMQSSLKVPP